MTEKKATAALTLALCALVAAVLIGCGSGGSASGSAGSGSFEGVQRPVPLDVTSVSMADARTGASVPLPPAAGEIALVYFGYTACPDICPTTFAHLQLALEDVGPLADRVTTVFVTVDPARDTATVLDRYVGTFVDRYSVVRIEDPTQLAAVEAPFQASSTVGSLEADGSYDVSHTALVYAVDSTGTVQVEWPFGTTADAFAHDLELLLQ